MTLFNSPPRGLLSICWYRQRAGRHDSRRQLAGLSILLALQLRVISLRKGLLEWEEADFPSRDTGSGPPVAFLAHQHRGKTVVIKYSSWKGRVVVTCGSYVLSTWLGCHTLISHHCHPLMTSIHWEAFFTF